ncbi:MAG: DUF2809 domain-containing protein [Flavobacteriaceae bacterium]|jgi:hypothetical protein|nr:DUF2809 domain-containing protein [Flavobacteriaceae bacterium]
MKFRFNFTAFLVFIIFLIIEVGIGVFIHDSFIRPWGGDFLVIFLIYYFAKTFIKTETLYLIVAVLLFAYAVEIAQYFKIADALHIKNKILRIIIGTSFSWGDLPAYSFGGICCYLLENRINNHKTPDKKRIF